MTLHLAHIPSGAGHVLVHYLFTGTYECHKPEGSSCYEKDAAEFATSVRVYAVAWEYGLPDLESLAKGEIKKLGDRLQVMQILDILKDELPNPSTDDTWLQDYLKSLIRAFINNPPASLGSLSSSSGRTLSIANVFLTVVVELWHEKTNPLSSSPNDLAVGQDRHDEPVAPHVEAGPAMNLEHNLTAIFEPLNQKPQTPKASSKTVLQRIARNQDQN
ncbi:hypothetical protein F5B17DRAFT_423513 [Nemania serpens]|nr:hypothetical protein F5B17DRAFT_423513 [Nemania serpens]